MIFMPVFPGKVTGWGCRKWKGGDLQLVGMNQHETKHSFLACQLVQALLHGHRGAA
jgi:hypothetical protein